VTSAPEAEPVTSASPNLFMVGAPKSGTTALASYLGQHPDVFVAAKELTYFGSDLEFVGPKGGRWRISRAAYLKWFEDAPQKRYRADRSVFYLYSKRAATEIHAFDPGSQIVVLVRSPVDQMYSQHSEMVFQGDEDITNFADAIAAEGPRQQGERIPASCRKPFALQYRAIARYSEQVERYIESFGRGNVHILVYEEFIAHPAEQYRALLQSLDLDPDHRPPFDVVNANKVVRSATVRSLLRGAPSTVRALGRVVVRSQYSRAALRRRLHTLNTVQRSRPPMKPELRAALQEEFGPEITRLEGIMGRELTSWRTPSPVPRV
jgi:hypothetical protein